MGGIGGLVGCKGGAKNDDYMGIFQTKYIPEVNFDVLFYHKPLINLKLKSFFPLFKFSFLRPGCFFTNLPPVTVNVCLHLYSLYSLNMYPQS